MGRYKKDVLEILRLIIGTVFMAFAVNWVYEPMSMVTGGVSGIAITIKAISQHFLVNGIPVWISNFVINIPIFIVGFFVKGKNFILKTLLANTVFSAGMYLIPIYNVANSDYFLAAVIGGVLTGIGLGIVFAAGYSTGGTDLLSSIICRYIPYYPVSMVLFVLDSLVIISGAVTFGIRGACYAVVAVFISSRVMDFIMSGGKASKQVFIISDKYEDISKSILENMERGATLIRGQGMYSGNEKPILLCVVSKKEIVKLTSIVKKTDKYAFVIISETREVIGEGFEENI